MASIFLSLPVSAQPAADPEFEVASVKPSPPTPGLSALLPGRGELIAQNATLMRLISFAYDLPYTSISGPPWLDSTRFDVFATGKADTQVTGIKLMTRALLAERFGLQYHRETKSANVYFLVLAGSMVKMQPADEPLRPHSPNLPPGARTMAADATMEEFAIQLCRLIPVPIIDRTGVAGKFHYYLWWGPDPDTDPEIFEALPEQLGLKLKPGKSEVEFLVIDRVNRTPSEN